MEKTNIILKKIDEIIEVICIVYDETELNFSSGVTLVTEFEKAFQKANSINIKEIKHDIWQATTLVKREYQINQLINTKFEKLISWKNGVYNLDALKDELNKDLDIFFQKQLLLHRNYSANDKSNIIRFYIAIGLRLIKACLDLKNVIAQLKKMCEEELTQIENNEISQPESKNIKLNPAKIGEFTNIVFDLFEKGFFIPVESTLPFSYSDVMIAFGNSLHTFLPIPNNSNYSKNLPTSTHSQGKGFADYLIHENKYNLADAIKDEFSLEKGKTIRLLLHVLENNNPKIITINYGQRKKLHTAMTDFFGRNIGRYQSIFDYKVDEKIDKKDLESISTRLNHILSTRQ
jgi:hypothetical protein